MSDNTFFAPGARDELHVIQNEADYLSTQKIGQTILDAIPDIALILNDKRQIVAANDHCLAALGVASVSELLGLRPGEAVHCIHATQGPSGCGTSIACRECGAANAIVSCLRTQECVEHECRITAKVAEGEESMDFLARANFVRIGPYPLVLLVLRDNSAEKRKQALERLFFHDVLNTVGGMAGLADLMTVSPAEKSAQYAVTIQHLASSVAEEVTAYRDLVLAEAGNLAVTYSSISLEKLLDEVLESLGHHPACSGRTFTTYVEPGCSVQTDHTLLRRVVINMAKNAAEACARGSEIHLTGECDGNVVMVSVNNPGVIPKPVQSQLFKRSFSTKGESGRGLGTYSIKLFTERYLHGTVSVESCETRGTTFTITLPLSQ